ncbi:ribosomal protein L27, partial [Zopfochytrium polystomum]
QQRPATKKSGGSSANGRTSNPKFLGLKRGAGARVSHPGQIIIRQRGTQWHPGPGVGCGRDHTLYATRAGWVVFSYDLARQRRVVWV